MVYNYELILKFNFNFLLISIYNLIYKFNLTKMTSTNATPQLHLIGEIKGANGFDGNRVFCKFSIRSGHNWTLISGKDYGETYEEIKDETEN
mgnify:CR=1 FL=1